MQEEIQQEIQQLRVQTRQLIKNLYNATKDREGFEYAVDPIRDSPKIISHIKESEPKVREPISNIWKSSLMPKPKSKTKTSSTVDIPKQSTRITVPISSKIIKEIETRQKQKNADMLNQDDDFYIEMQEFRKLYSDMFITKQEYHPKQKSQKAKVLRPPNSPLKNHPRTIFEETQYHETGFFRVNSKGEIDQIDHPFKNVQESDWFKDENIKYLSEHDPPVKVSIPKTSIVPFKRQYIPHRRSSFGPEDSVDINDYLMRGYEQPTKSRRRLGQGVSLEHECVINLRKELRNQALMK